MSYARDNCRDGFSACSKYIIKIYSVLIFPLVALLHRSLARSMCERTFILTLLNIHPAGDVTRVSVMPRKVTVNIRDAGNR